MSKKKTPKRDKKGDIKFDYSKVDWDKIREDRHTYIFRYHDEKTDHYFPCFGLFSLHDPKMEEAKQNPKYFERQLYIAPANPPYDKYIRYSNWLLSLRVEFFKEVFEERAFIEGYMPQTKYSRVILPKATHDQIMACITEFGLLQIQDLIFEIIAIAQDKYTDDIAHWERPEMQKLITTAEKETKKAINIIDKLDDRAWLRGKGKGKNPSKLSHINFAFNDGTVKIEHHWLAQEFIEHFKDYYGNLHFKDWKKDLERYPDRFKDNIKKQQFKYNLAKSLYNLFTVGKFFEITEKQPTPNKLMLCIARVIEFCLIPVADPDELDEIKIKSIRNWIKRKELKPDVTFAKVPYKKAKLLKYFEPAFVALTNETKRADALHLGIYLAKRFELDHLFPELAHIAQALKGINMQIGHQMFSGGIQPEARFPEFDSLRKLIHGVKEKKKINSLKFKIDGDNTEYELSQRLPLHLLEQALKEYSEDHQVEFDTDLVTGDITKTQKGTKIKNLRFNEPHERFMVHFVTSFYNFLLKEAPPDEHDPVPSDRYYSIIGEMLQKTWFFYHQRHPDWFIAAKVKQWHNLGE